MKQFNKFLALALVAGVFSTNLVNVDAANGGAGMGMEEASFYVPDELVVTQAEVDALSADLALAEAAAQRARGKHIATKNKLRSEAAAKLGVAKIGLILHERSGEVFAIVDGQKQVVVSRSEALADKRRKEAALRIHERRAARFADLRRPREEVREEVQVELTVVDQLIAALENLVAGLRTESGSMSAGTKEFHDAFVKPYDVYAAEVAAFIVALNANRQEIAAEMVRINAEPVEPVIVPVPVEPVVVPAWRKNIHAKFTNFAARIGAGIADHPTFFKALTRVVPGALVGAGLGFALPYYAPVFVPMAAVYGSSLVGGVAGGTAV